MLVLVVDIMWKSLLLYKLVLLYNDNLIKCDTSLKNKNTFILMEILNVYLLMFTLLYFLM